jgi:hypothetical protein
MLEADPRAYFERITHEIHVLKEEKDAEKKYSSKLQSEVSTVAGTSASLDLGITAEQILYVTAGLNLIILPEHDVDPSVAASYPEREPIVRGEKARGISHAAALAGEAMLDRARKATALHIERQQRRRLAGDDARPTAFDLIQHARLAAVATIPMAGMPTAVSSSASILPPTKVSTGRQGSSKQASGKGGKGGARSSSRNPTQNAVAAASSMLSNTTLLSVAPLADQVSTANGKLAASTSALLARSCILKTTQQRLRHPYPDSMGGRRRANSSKKDEFLQSHLTLTLPPLPSTRERLERKPQPVSTEPPARAANAVRDIFKLFDGKSVSKIQLMSGIRKLSESATLKSGDSNSIESSASHDGGLTGSFPTPTTPIDPVVTFSVLHAIGLVQVTDGSQESQLGSGDPVLDVDEECLVWSDKLKALRSQIGKATRTENILVTNRLNDQVERSHDSERQPNKGENDVGKEVTVESIRGGGDSSEGSTDEASESGEREAPVATSASTHTSKHNTTKGADSIAGKRKHSDPAVTNKPQSRRKYSDPGVISRAAVAAAASQSTQLLSSQMAAIGQFGSAYGQTAAFNAFQMANRLRSVQHPAGELAGYNLSSLFQGNAARTLSSLGLVQPAGLVGFDGSGVSAAALLSSSPFPQASSPYAHVSTCPAAVNAYMGSSASLLHGHGPYSLSGSQVQTQRPRSHTQTVSAEGPGDSSSKSTKPAADPVLEPPPTSVDQCNASQDATDGKESTAQSLPGLVERIDVRRGSLNSPPGHQSPERRSEHQQPNSASTAAATATKDLTTPPVTSLPLKNSELIKQGKFDLAILDLSDELKSFALDVLGAAAASVPIPKSVVAGPLKEKFTNIGFKSPGGGASNVPRDFIVSVILVWLWANHRGDFQRAFDTSGRFDVDPGCKWLIQIAVETAVRAVSLDIAESLEAGKGLYAEVCGGRKSGSKSTLVQDSNVEMVDRGKKVDLHSASLVNKALSAAVQIDARLSRALSQYQQYVDYLDEARLCALRAKAQERTMLATLISRKTMMTESFANAYVSSMVRAGEALGHDNLFEAVQDIDANISSMIPYDILTAEEDLWEEPCKPEGSYAAGMKGDDLLRRAHARAMLHKSLRKLQERNQIRGGTANQGPYADHPRHGTSGGSEPPAASPRVGSKRKGTFGESLPPGGTGSAKAKAWAVYEPSHYSAPLEWQADHSENMPYGLHRVGERVRSLSLSLSARSGEPRNIKKAKRSSSFSGTTGVIVESVKAADGVPKSTREINWGDIAGIFQSVELPKKSPPSKSGDRGHHGESGIPSSGGSTNRTIYAPYVGEIDFDGLRSQESESDGEEDLSDEGFMVRHQLVLDAMKARHAALLEARRRIQEERRKSKSNK